MQAMNAILIIDDEPSICGVIQDFFETSQGMIVQCAHTGSDATRMLTQQQYDLAVIDLSLPGISSIELAALAANGNTPVLLMTGDPVLHLTMQQFAFPYMAKPFTLDALRTAAAQVMSDRARHVVALKTSLGKLHANRDALTKAMAESDRVLDVARTQQQLGRWNAAAARARDALSEDCSENR
jgi:DNA-binding NtrC family response regulator